MNKKIIYSDCTILYPNQHCNLAAKLLDLKEEDERRSEASHSRFLRPLMGVTRRERQAKEEANEDHT